MSDKSERKCAGCGKLRKSTGLCAKCKRGIQLTIDDALAAITAGASGAVGPETLAPPATET